MLFAVHHTCTGHGAELIYVCAVIIVKDLSVTKFYFLYLELKVSYTCLFRFISVDTYKLAGNKMNTGYPPMFIFILIGYGPD